MFWECHEKHTTISNVDLRMQPRMAMMFGMPNPTLQIPRINPAASVSILVKPNARTVFKDKRPTSLIP